MTVTRTPSVDRTIPIGPLGALPADAQRAPHGHARAAVPVSSVEAGDRPPAEFLAAGEEGTDAHAAPLAWRTAAVMLPRVPLPGS